MSSRFLLRCWKVRLLNPYQLRHVRFKSQSHYDVLGVRRDASEKEIKEAYRDMCKKLHPDVNKSDPGTHEKFVQLNEAYQVLSERMSRKKYDDEILDKRTVYKDPVRGENHANDLYEEEILRQMREQFRQAKYKQAEEELNMLRRVFWWVWEYLLPIIICGISIQFTIIVFSRKFNKKRLDDRDMKLHSEHLQNQDDFLNYYSKGLQPPTDRQDKTLFTEDKIEYIYDKPPPKKKNFPYIKKKNRNDFEETEEMKI